MWIKITIIEMLLCYWLKDDLMNIYAEDVLTYDLSNVS